MARRWVRRANQFWVYSKTGLFTGPVTKSVFSGKYKPLYETPRGRAYLPDSRPFMATLEAASVNLVFTSRLTRCTSRKSTATRSSEST